MHALLFNMKLSVKLRSCTITWILCYNVANVHNKWIPVEDMQVCVWGWVGRIASEEVFSCRPILSCNLKDPKGAEWGRAWSWIHVHTLWRCVCVPAFSGKPLCISALSFNPHDCWEHCSSVLGFGPQWKFAVVGSQQKYGKKKGRRSLD